MQKAYVSVIEDYSSLGQLEFWARMDAKGRIWRFNHQVLRKPSMTAASARCLGVDFQT